MVTEDRRKEIDKMAYEAVFGENKVDIRKRIMEDAKEEGIYPASIHHLYMAVGRGDAKGFTVPAINIRGLTYDIARTVFRTAMAIDAGPFIFEIARTEISYTQQRPGEYAAVIFAAALREGYKGPVFIQGDHFQTNPKKYMENPQKEKDEIKGLIVEAIEAGFYNIDIDTSTLVDLSKESVIEQQRPNFEACAEFTKFIRDNQPKGVMISVGGEIGEVGHKNSTPEELEAFMNGYLKCIEGYTGISKVSVQTGTSHGGIPLPDGTVAKVKLDFDTLTVLSKMARERYGMGGAVQHGASTLPLEFFDRFPETGCVEIHLATEFQNIIYEGIPSELRDRIYTYLSEKCADERKPGDTDEQFYYKTRKKGFGPFKREFYDLPEDVRSRIMEVLENRFRIIFEKLGVSNTRHYLKFIE